MREKKRSEILRENALKPYDSVDRPNGYVYAYVDGKKEFYSLDKVFIGESEMTVGELAQEVKGLYEKVDKLEKFIKKTLRDISSYKVLD